MSEDVQSEISQNSTSSSNYCDICTIDKVPITDWKLHNFYYHQRYHINCGFCEIGQAVVYSVSSLMNHIKNKHKTIYCNHRSRWFADIINTQVAGRKLLPSNSELICNGCKIEFESLNDLYLHGCDVLQLPIIEPPRITDIDILRPIEPTQIDKKKNKTNEVETIRCYDCQRIIVKNIQQPSGSVIRCSDCKIFAIRGRRHEKMLKKRELRAQKIDAKLLSDKQDKKSKEFNQHIDAQHQQEMVEVKKPVNIQQQREKNKKEHNKLHEELLVHEKEIKKYMKNNDDEIPNPILMSLPTQLPTENISLNPLEQYEQIQYQYQLRKQSQIYFTTLYEYNRRRLSESQQQQYQPPTKKYAHNVNNHPNWYGKKIHCQLCWIEVKNKRALMIHMGEHHSNFYRTCSLCGVAFVGPVVTLHEARCLANNCQIIPIQI